MNDKIIVTNLGVLKKKYGAAGLSKIQTAVRALIAADKARGLQTRLVALESAAMKKEFGASVSDPASARQNKGAIDAIFAKVRPDYLLILGAIDVVPHQDVINPVFGADDEDEYAFGDIPYACEQPYSQQADKFIGPTRVVSRLPDLNGGTDPSYLVGLLKTTANWKARPRGDYADYFAISADQWKNSTALSVQKLFGSDKSLNLSPKAGPNWSGPALAPLTHFINCHGGPADPQFYGQKGKSYPIAHDAALISGKITEGTIAAAECCYGAQLYDPNLLTSKQPGICNVYLADKTYGFFGSSTIAYGPPTGNGSADLLCQYFVKQVLAGASIGRAALEARQEFAQAGSALDPFDLKTLAQFSLLGDPSITPVIIPPSHVALTGAQPKRLLLATRDMMPARLTPIARAERRKQALSKGMFISLTQSVACRNVRAPVTGALAELMARLAADFEIPKPKVMSFQVQAGSEGPGGAKTRKAFAAAEAKLPDETTYHIAIGSVPAENIPVKQIKAVVAKASDGKVVSYRELVSR